MKKVYLNPKMEVVSFSTMGMLALSKGGPYNNEPTLAPRYGRNDRNGKYDPNFDEEEDEEEDW